MAEQVSLRVLRAEAAEVRAEQQGRQAVGAAPFLVGLYLSAAAVLTFIALWLTRETRDNDYENNIA